MTIMVTGDHGGGVAREDGRAHRLARTSRRRRRYAFAGMLVMLLACAVPGMLVSTASACADFTRAPSSRWQASAEHGISWLVTPCGDRFFSLGVNVVDGGVQSARPSYAWVRYYPDPLAFWTATRGRLLSWSFNTLGAYSVPAQLLKFPVTFDIRLGQTAGFHWIDPFHPDMGEAMKAWAAYLVGPYRGNSMRIGYFSDNEIGWWNGTLYAFYVKKPASNHTKQRLVTLLREHYSGDWHRFTNDFVVHNLNSFDALLHSEERVPTLRPGGAGIQAVRRWTAQVAGHYYRLVHDALRAADPDALILGDRLPIYYDPVAIKAMQPYVDVISVNYDVDSADGWIGRYFFDGLRRLADKPVLISEWFYSAHENRSGNRNSAGLMTVATQAERAQGAGTAVHNFARQPAIVGLHWYLFYDEPAGGHSGGDHNFGLLDIHNEPYAEVVAALTQANAQVMEVHRAAPLPESTTTTHLPYARIDPNASTLNAWPKPASLVLPWTPSAGEVPFGDLYATWSEQGVGLAFQGMDYYDFDLLAHDGPFPRTEAFRIWIGIDAGAGPQRFVLNLIPRERKDGEPYDHTPELCGVADSGCPPVEGVQARSFWFSQPRINAKVLIPWTVLGIKPASHPAAVRLDVAATAFFRSRWMSLSGLPPEEALARPEQWRSLHLSPAVSSTR